MQMQDLVLVVEAVVHSVVGIAQASAFGPRPAGMVQSSRSRNVRGIIVIEDDLVKLSRPVHSASLARGRIRDWQLIRRTCVEGFRGVHSEIVDAVSSVASSLEIDLVGKNVR